MSMTLISEQVLGSAVASVTFSSIPGTYTDLLLEIEAQNDWASNNTQFAKLQYNSDTAANYSRTRVSGDGTSAASYGGANETGHFVDGPTGNTATAMGLGFVHLLSYASTSVYKTALMRGSDALSFVIASANLWRSTAAITSILVLPGQGTVWKAGSTFRLWGVK